MSANLFSLRRPWFGIARPVLALAALLILGTALGGCESFDPARISVNVDPSEIGSIGW